MDIRPLLADPAAAPAPRSLVFSENIGRAMVFDGTYKYVHYDTGEAELYKIDYQQQRMYGVVDEEEVENLLLKAATGRIGGEPEVDYTAIASRMRAFLIEHWLRNAAVASDSIAGTGPIGTAAHELRAAREMAFAKEGKPSAPFVGSVVTIPGGDGDWAKRAQRGRL